METGESLVQDQTGPQLGNLPEESKGNLHVVPRSSSRQCLIIYFFSSIAFIPSSSATCSKYSLFLGLAPFVTCTFPHQASHSHSKLTSPLSTATYASSLWLHPVASRESFRRESDTHSWLSGAFWNLDIILHNSWILRSFKTSVMWTS